MRHWRLTLPLLYLILLSIPAVFDLPRNPTLPLFWLQIGGTVLMAILGCYLDGTASKMEAVGAGLFTLLWLGMSFVVEMRWEFFALLGLGIESILMFVLGRIATHGNKGEDKTAIL